MNFSIVFWSKVKILGPKYPSSKLIFTFLNLRVAVERKRVPEFVFLAHGVDVMSAMHAPFVFRSFASMPYTTRLFLLPMWPFTFLVTLGMWAWSKTFLFSFYKLRNNLCQTWGVPRFGFQVYLFLKYSFVLYLKTERFDKSFPYFFFWLFLQYFLPFATKGINNQIEAAILRADKIGVKVISLAALNKVLIIIEIENLIKH